VKPSSVPFWWVVKHRDGGYIGEYVDKHVQHQREAGRNWAREDAEFAAAWWEDAAHYVVKVHARIPEPKLPAWVKPLAFHYRHVQVFFRLRPAAWVQYVFYVSVTGDLSVKEAVVHEEGEAPRMESRDVVAAHFDVWAEAAQRAAKMLRARKAGK
jgi:hypothetical protein